MATPFPKFSADTLPDEGIVLRRLVSEANLDAGDRQKISKHATTLVENIRSATRPGVMESFLAEYGLSTNEGVALMCLAEALLRVPDAKTIDALIEDKIAPSDWRQHLGHSTSALVNASTWGLMLTGKVLDKSNTRVLGTMKSVVKRLGEPVIRKAVGQAMREMGRQFVLGETIEKALKTPNPTKMPDIPIRMTCLARPRELQRTPNVTTWRIQQPFPRWPALVLILTSAKTPVYLLSFLPCIRVMRLVNETA